MRWLEVIEKGWLLRTLDRIFDNNGKSGILFRLGYILNALWMSDRRGMNMQRKPLGDDPWRMYAWTPGSLGVNDSGSPFLDMLGPTPGPWGINDGSPGCILGMTNGLHLEPPPPQPAPSASTSAKAAAPTPLYVVTFKHAEVPSTPNSTILPGGEDTSGANRAGYTKVTLTKKVEIEWDNGSARADAMIPFFSKAVKVAFALDPITVAVSSDYPVGSCPYRVTLKHEIEDHAKPFIKIFLSYREILVNKLNAITFPTERAPRWIKPQEIPALQDMLGKQVGETVKAVSASLVADMEKDRRAKDSPDAYAAIYRQCPADDWQMKGGN